MPFEGPGAAHDPRAEKAEGGELAERLKAVVKIPSRWFGEAYQTEAVVYPESRGMFESERTVLGYHNIMECAKLGLNDMTHSSIGTIEDSTKMLSSRPYRAEESNPEHQARIAEITRDAVATLERIGQERGNIGAMDQEIAGFLRRRFDGFMETLDERGLSPQNAETVRKIHRAVTGILDTGVNPNNQDRAPGFVTRYPAAMVVERIGAVESLSPDLQRTVLPDLAGRRMAGDISEE